MAICPNCGQENPSIARFCLACASLLAPVAEPEREERKVVTVLFCDLVGFTARSDEADPEDVKATLRPYHARVRREIEGFGGTVEKFIGDAVMALFGAPIAHEDDPERAVRSGLGILQAITELNENQVGPELAVRVGIDTGEAVVALGGDGRGEEGIAAGDVVNTAARLQGTASIGTVVVGEATYRATRHVIDYEPLVPAVVKGKAHPIQTWKAKGAHDRFGVDVFHQVPRPFVGRQDELEILRRAYARALREPSLQVVTVAGEPGVGKSRLIAEFMSYVESQPDLVYRRQGRCLPYGEGITFWALGEIVKAQAEILESDSPDEASAKLSSAVEAVVAEPSERQWMTDRLRPLVGVAPSEQSPDRTESFAAWRLFIEATASARPLVLVFDDLHWAGEAMLEFLEHLIDWSTDVPLLVVCSTRPELYERHPDWGGGKRNSTTIALPPLSEQETEQLISSLLSDDVLPGDVRSVLLDRAGGNPLFAEEFVRMLTDQRGNSGPARSLGTAINGEVPVPDSVHAVIAARLDTLPVERKSLLQDASVLGKIFWSGALAFVGGTDERSIREGLHDLTRKELVRPARASSVKDQSEYMFWHVLIRDVAYAQMPRAIRASKHRAAAEWIERLAGDRVGDHADVLAHHYRQALELTRATGADVADLEEACGRAYVMAGDRAMALDIEKATERYREALDFFPPGHPQRGRTLAKGAEAAAQAGRFEAAERTYEEAIAEMRAGGNVIWAGDAMVRLSTLLWHRGETTRCRAVLSEAIALLEREPPGPELLNAYTELAIDKTTLGLFQEAAELSNQALALAEDIGAPEQKPRALGFRGMARCYLGDMAGFDDLRQALAMSVDLGLGRDAARIHGILMEVLWATEGPGPALESAREGIKLAERRGITDMAMAIRAQMLGPRYAAGDWDEVLRVADEVLGWAGGRGGAYFGVQAAASKAQVLLGRAQLKEAASMMDSFLPAARRIGDFQVLVPALVVSALVEHASGSLDAAVSLVEEIDGMTEDRSGLYLGQYLTDLVRLCVAAKRTPLARHLMQGVNDRFVRNRNCLITATALLKEVEGDFGEAARAAADAGNQWKKSGFVVEWAHALMCEGRTLLALGRPEAEERLRAAREIFVRLGALAWVPAVDPGGDGADRGQSLG